MVRHEVLHMMEGNSYSEISLKEAIIKKFGKHRRFYICSIEDMDTDTLIGFLKEEGKFMSSDDGFAVNITKMCNHSLGCCNERLLLFLSATFLFY